ncbi:MAG TPA: aspartyl protease family protein [Candidatus Eisenbacteria bacterium]
MPRFRRPSALARIAVLGALGAATAAAHADWLQPDPSYRQAQSDLRQAQRDTAGRADDPGRLDSLAVALLRVGRLDDAEKLFRRVLDAAPGDDAAHAGLGKLALFHDRAAAAETLLAACPPDDAGARADLFAARLRLGEYGAAAELAEAVGEPGRAPLLQQLAEGGAYLVTNPREVRVQFARLWPVPLVRVGLNGQSVLMAIDTGVGDLLIDESAARRCGIKTLPAESPALWSCTRIAVKEALVPRIEIGGVRIERVPAGVLSLRRYSLEINPQSEGVAGVIGINLLRRFTPTLDYVAQRLVLRPAGTAYAPAGIAQRIPFEIWGENELTVYGSIAGGRRMAMVLASGLPAAGAGAPQEVFDELGIKPGVSASLAKGGVWLRGDSWFPVTVPTVALGQRVRDRLPGWSGAMEQGEMWRHGVRRDALLAGMFFRGLRVTIDWRGRSLVLEE